MSKGKLLFVCSFEKDERDPLLLKSSTLAGSSQKQRRQLPCVTKLHGLHLPFVCYSSVKLLAGKEDLQQCASMACLWHLGLSHKHTWRHPLQSQI